MDRRTLIAFLLIGLITFVWIWHNQALERERTTIHSTSVTAPANPPETATTSTLPAATPEQAPGPTAPVAPNPPTTTPNVPLRDDIRLAAPEHQYLLRWTNRGAALTEARLRDYAEHRHSTERERVLEAYDTAPASLSIRDPKGELPLDSQNYEVLADTAERVAFGATFANGLRVTKEFIPAAGKYDLRVRVTLKNTGAQPLSTQYDIVAASRVTPESEADTDLQGAIGVRYSNGNVSIDREAPGSVSRKPYKRNANDQQPIDWAGAANRYFAAILKPVAKEGTTFKTIDNASIEALPDSEVLLGQFGGKSRAGNVLVKMQTQRRTLQPGAELTDEYVYFIGPKDQRVLAHYPELAGILDYGWFGFFSKVLLAILNALHHLIPNYGVGIILLTILVKVALHPVTRKGQIAMHRMQRLQPLIKEMQEKYKDDRQRQGREMMELYRRHGANPMSGCWPVALQIPILFGLFRMLQYSIDLRQASFLPVWVTDLAKPDTVGYIGSLPINILPVLMVVSWVAQQWTMPKPADPQQAQTQKMMMFMPIVFGFMLYGTASGLTLYWLTSTFLGIVEQKLIKLQIAKMEERGEFSALTTEAAPAKAKAKPPRRK